MKYRIINEEPKFNPIKIELTIDSPDELKYLYAISNTSKTDAYKRAENLVEGKFDIDGSSEGVQCGFFLLMQNLYNKHIINS